MATTKTKKSAKKVPAKRNVAKSTVKKTSTTRKPVKRTASKRIVTKRPSVKKSTAKMVTVKKSTSVKKSTAKKAVTKKNAKRAIKKSTKSSTVSTRSRAVASTAVATGLSYSVPEVPVRKPSTKNLGAATELLRPVGSKTEIDTPALYNKRDRKTLRVILLAVSVLAGVAFVIYSFSGSRETSTALKPSASPSPTLDQNEIASPPPSDSSSVAKTFSLTYRYNSIGITMIFGGALSLGNVESIDLIAQPSSGPKIKFGTYTGSTSTVRIAKIDTVGQTKFTALAKFSDGSTITSGTLSIRGAFETI